MKESIYIKGRGITIKLLLSELNNLYRPNSVYKSESFDYIYVKNSLSRKFAPILLKEWFFMIKPGGFLIIDYTLTKELTFQSVEELCWWLLRGDYNYNIEEHIETKEGSRIVIRKKHSLFAKDDSMDKWSFGIVTNGDRDEWIEEIIQSIRNLKIPHYEIIVCGKYRDRKEKDFIYIDFNERLDKGWITKKKNLIAERAAYENLCIVHDRLIFDKGWYKGMQKYGNTFELIGCIQKEKNTGVQAGDWLTLGGPTDTRYKVARLSYDDWDYYVYLSGQLTMIKKSIWEKVLWDETRYWDDYEDTDISFRARDKGHIIRFNPYAICYALTWRHGKLPLKYSRQDGLLPKDMILRRILWFFLARIFIVAPFTNNLFAAIRRWFYKSKIYKYLIYH